MILSDETALTINDPRVQPCPTTGCWLWTLRGGVAGYGQVSIAGKQMRAHRAFYERAHGKVPDGLVLDHTCRVRACVNPDHLRAVTTAINNTENSMSPSAQNRDKTACPKCGGAYKTRMHVTKGYEFRYCPDCKRKRTGERRKEQWAEMKARAETAEQEVAALRRQVEQAERERDETRIACDDHKRVREMESKRAADVLYDALENCRAELATLRAKAEIVDAMERELRKVGDGVLIGFAREYSDYSEYEGKHYHWPETFYFGDEMQDGAPYASLGEAFTAYAQARAAQEPADG